MGTRTAVIIALVLTSCHPNASTSQQAPSKAVDEIRYVSADSKFGMVFSENSFRAGYAMMLEPGRSPDVPLKAISSIRGVRCVSVGPSGNSEEFAIKRPIKPGDQYKCLGTSFKVEKCFDDCASAIIDRDVPASGGRVGTIPSFMLVDRCAGMLAHSQVKDFTDGIPLNSVLLRGKVGILADKDGAACR